MPESFPICLRVAPHGAHKRLDQFLAAHLPETSRARVQQLIGEEKVLVNDVPAKASARLRGAEQITVLGVVELPPLRATRRRFARHRL